MSAAALARPSATRLDDPLRSLLAGKPRVVFSIPPDASVYDAIALMSERRVGALAVLSGERLVGIISERDYARKVILKGKSSKETRVDQIMSAPVITVTPRTTVTDCMRLMSEHRIRHLPVMEGDRVVAMTSIGDLVSWVIQSQAELIRQLEGYINGTYPG
jgi:CBS domain-containing protein